MSKTRTVRNALAGTAVSVLAVGLVAAPAQADHGHDNPCKPSRVHCKFKAKSNLSAVPSDQGGRNARTRITGFRGGGKYAADFQAYDEVLYLRDDNADSHKALVKVRYYGPGGPYKYRYKTGSSRAIQLGSDNDLTENKRIKIKLCIDHHGCTKWAKAYT
ncbi:hypothetical protein [Solicola gregarius]|uniref:Secreted protein n=1 Tax=Solicola gregarius TaxID=2908642 RepID=A0AA46TKY1_9ACTN|nr:hypothetical protein [Solicola gregarius]UYM06812.1 hypothetical protein L0C25_06980 [Solicola gregarius]